MKKIIAFGGSNSRQSINKQLAGFVLSQVQEIDGTLLDLNNFVLPIYGIDHEKEQGIPAVATAFRDQIAAADGIILSLAEHNGSYTAAFKNLLDWLSRINKEVWMNKPMLLLATSPGGRGAATVLAQAKDSFPRFGGNIIADFSLPRFSANMQDGVLIDEELRQDLLEKIAQFQKAL